MKKKSENKSAFVRRYPLASAKDVVVIGAKAGLKFTEKYVYAVRWKLAARKALTTLGDPESDKVIAPTYKYTLTRNAEGGGWRVVTKPPESEVTPRTPVTRFKQLALEIGLTQAYALLAELRASVFPPA